MESSGIKNEEVDPLSIVKAFHLARKIYARGIEDGCLIGWQLDEVANLIVLDLHSLSLATAATAVSFTMEKIRSGEIPLRRLRIITGRGNHVNSSGTRGVLRAEIEYFIAEDFSSGSLLVTEKVPGNEGCIDISAESLERWIAQFNSQQHG